MPHMVDCGYSVSKITLTRFYMDKKISWDDIPSLEGGEIDWSYKPQSALDNRKFARLNMGSVFQLLEVLEIVVRLVTTNQTLEGKLIDISQGGLALALPFSIELNTPVKVGLFLGAEKIISRGLVQHVKQVDDHFITGIQFVNLPAETAKYLAELYASKALHHPPS